MAWYAAALGVLWLLLGWAAWEDLRYRTVDSAILGTLLGTGLLARALYGWTGWWWPLVWMGLGVALWRWMGSADVLVLVALALAHPGLPLSAWLGALAWWTWGRRESPFPALPGFWFGVTATLLTSLFVWPYNSG